jgi:hypothetical protein
VKYPGGLVSQVNAERALPVGPGGDQPEGSPREKIVSNVNAWSPDDGGLNGQVIARIPPTLLAIHNHSRTPLLGCAGRSGRVPPHSRD